MNESHAPSRSLPPPSLPREFLASARVRTLTEEFAGVADPHAQALCAFELGALHEHGLHEPEIAEAHYRRTLELSPTFVPALFALTRMAIAQRRPAEAAELWQAIAEATRNAATRAEALCEAGILQGDARGQRKRALGLWNAALGIDSGSRIAAMLLEQDARGRGDAEAIERSVALHAASTADIELKAQLLMELAADADKRGEGPTALAQLEKAAELGEDSRAQDAIWLETERIARAAGDPERLTAALHAIGDRWLSRVERTYDPDQQVVARDQAVAWLRECARSIATPKPDASIDLRGALACYDRAIGLRPTDSLLRWERMLAHEALGQYEAAAADASALLDAKPASALTAALSVKLAELLYAQGQPRAARALLETTCLTYPNCGAAIASFEDLLLETGALQALRDRLQARAHGADAQARAEHTLHASRITLLELADPQNALARMQEAATHAPQPKIALLTRYAAARKAGKHEPLDEVIEELCQGALDKDEHAALRFDQYLHLLRHADDPRAADRQLRVIMSEPENAIWAYDAARVRAASTRDYALLAQAHQALALTASDSERAAAHYCGAARAALRAGDATTAIDLLRLALGKAPDDVYAASLLEECLLASGAGQEAAQVLRDSAQRRADDHQREVTLLHAGAAAESAGDVQEAARCYEQAASSNPSALGPRWALRRVAERGGDAVLFERALLLLAEREAAIGDPGLSALELAEHFASQGLGSNARAHLAAVLEEPTLGSAAALGIGLLPDAAIDVGLRDRAHATLNARGGEAARRMWLRDGIALALAQDPAQGEARVSDALAEHPRDAWLRYQALWSSTSDEKHVDGILQLARISDAATAAELALCAVRTTSLCDVGDRGAEALLSALQAAQTAPHSLAAAVAVDESLGPLDDPAARASALHVLLTRARPELGQPLRAAHARALLSASRPSEAAEAARRALAHDDGDLGMWEVLRVASLQLEDFETAVEASLRLASVAQGPCCARLLEEVAALLEHELSRTEEAERYLHAAFSQDAACQHAFADLHDRLLDRGDTRGLLALLERRLEVEADPAERRDLTLELALVLRSQGHSEAALDALQPVIAEDPQHIGALGLLIEASTALQRWSVAIDGLRKLGQAAVPDAQKRLAVLGAADFLERHLHDDEAAYEELAALRARGLADKDVLLRLAALSERLKRYRQAVETYQSAVALCAGPDAARLERKSAEVLHQQLGATGEAVTAYKRALLADPLDAASCSALLQLDEASTSRATLLTTFEQALRARLDREPLAPELLRLLVQLGQWQGDDDQQVVALHALHALHLATYEEQATLLALDANLLPQQDTALSAETLDRLCPELTLASMTRVAELVSLGLQDTSGRRQPSATPTRAERFENGRRAMAQRRSVLPLATSSRAAQRQALRTAIALGGREQQAQAGDPLPTKELEKSLTRADRKELVRAARAIEQPEFAIEEYLEALELSCARAGLVQAGDLSVGLQQALGVAQTELEMFVIAPRALELLRFWLGKPFLELRRELRGARP